MFDILWYPSPNWNERDGQRISCIVLHNTAGTAEGALAHLCNSASSVSAHYLVDRNGKVFQLVDDTKCAWHAGNRPVNKKSIGIEIEAYASKQGFSPQQELAVLSLTRWLAAKYRIPASSIIAHRDVLDVHTECPGFIWPTDKDFELWKERSFA